GRRPCRPICNRRPCPWRGSRRRVSNLNSRGPSMNRPATARSRAPFRARSLSRSRASVSGCAVVQALEERLVMSAAFDQTGLTDLRLNPTFAGIDGSGVGVAVLDTGIYAAHPLLAPNVVAYYNAVTTPLPNAIHAT